MSLILFDIDGTLLLSGGAGVRAMTRAFEQTFGVANAFANIDIAGRTDRYLVSAALDCARLPDEAGSHLRFREAYLPLLASEIQQPGTGRRGVMPGVERLLNAMTNRGDLHLALLTGNYESAAGIKLGFFGLRAFFAWGAFGDESADRNELARLALARARDCAVVNDTMSDVIVVGDTPHDVEGARAIGARALAVATGSYSVKALEDAGADIVLADLSDTTNVLRLLRL